MRGWGETKQGPVIDRGERSDTVYLCRWYLLGSFPFYTIVLGCIVVCVD